MHHYKVRANILLYTAASHRHKEPHPSALPFGIHEATLAYPNIQRARVWPPAQCLEDQESGYSIHLRDVHFEVARSEQSISSAVAFDMAPQPISAKESFTHPDNLDPLTPVYRDGLITISIFAMMSLVSVTALLAFITHRLISWRKHYREYVGYNQYVILIYQLLLADLQQAIAFVMSFHWLHVNKITALTVPCFLQGWFLQIGDVASGFFVLAIAIHTWLGVVKGYKVPYTWFISSILGLWMICLLLTVLGPAMYQGRYFARAGGWVSGIRSHCDCHTH